jgi:hypothetical protein
VQWVAIRPVIKGPEDREFEPRRRRGSTLP